MGAALLLMSAGLGSIPWEGSAELHTQLEAASSVLGVGVGLLAFARYRSSPDTVFLFVAAGFIGTGVLDACHMLVTSTSIAPQMPSSLLTLSAWSWAASRTYLAVMLFLSSQAASRSSVGVAVSPSERVAVLSSERGVYVVGVLLTATCLLAFTFIPLPSAYFLSLPAPRPQEVAPGLLLAAALAQRLKSRKWESDSFEHWFVLSLIASVATQLVVMPFSSRLFDAYFDTGHILKIVSYCCVFVGLLHSVYWSFCQANATAEQLESQVGQRTADLNAALIQIGSQAVKLQRTNEELDDFAYVASHDLKAPLRDVQNLANWIVEDVGATLPPASTEHLKKLSGRVARMECLLDDVLRYSRAGRVFDDVVDVDVNALLEDVVAIVAVPTGFDIELPHDVPILVSPRSGLEQVFANLIANAIKHHDRSAGSVRVGWCGVGERIEFLVADDGPGIPCEYHERVFRMFQSLRSADEVEGSGIGLAIVKKLVDSHGGTITVESDGRGATFRFTWPRVWSAPPSARVA